MSYCINYDSIPVKQEIKKKWVSRKILAVCLAICASLALTFIPRVRMVLLGLVFPGIDAEGAEVLEALAVQIGEGVPLGEALHSFCIRLFSCVNG